MHTCWFMVKSRAICILFLTGLLTQQCKRSCETFWTGSNKDYHLHRKYPVQWRIPGKSHGHDPVSLTWQFESIRPDNYRNELITGKLKTQLKEPVVNVKLINFKVAVFGDVVNPGIYPVINERITVIEAVILAGDLKKEAVKSNILLIREVDKKILTNANIATAVVTFILLLFKF